MLALRPIVWLFQCTIDDGRKLFGFIILGFCVDVHGNLTVLMTCQILDRLWINSRIDQVGNIGVTQLMRRYCEVQAVHDIFPVYAFLPRLRLKLLSDRLSVHVFVQCAFFGAADLDIIPDPDKLRIHPRISAR